MIEELEILELVEKHSILPLLFLFSKLKQLQFSISMRLAG